MNTFSAPPVMTMPANTSGTDFVVGDLHGCFQLLDALLIQVRFDPARDRLFSVGDLIDRGPDSLACLQLLQEPWFFAVAGNHEAMLGDFFEDYALDSALPQPELDSWFNTGKVTHLNPDMLERKFSFLYNGGEWVKAYYEPGRQRMATEFDAALQNVFRLPKVIIVGEGQSRFQVVHAELVAMPRPDQEERVWLDADLDHWGNGLPIPEHTLEHLQWGRSLFSVRNGLPPLPDLHPGLSPTFCGHTIGTGIRKAYAHVCLDTGAFLTQPSYLGMAIDNTFGLTLFDTRQQQSYRS